MLASGYYNFNGISLLHLIIYKENLEVLKYYLNMLEKYNIPMIMQ